jgi:hypothetical protein
MTAPFGIRNSAFGIRPIRRALMEADRKVSSDELRTPNRVPPTSRFEIHPSSFASIRGQLLYSTQIPDYLWFLAKKKAAAAKRGFRNRRKQTLFIDTRKICTLIDRVHGELTDNMLSEQSSADFHSGTASRVFALKAACKNL